MRWLAFLAAVGLTTSISVAQAQDRPPDACVHAPTIVTVADFLLTEPVTKPNFWRDRAGDDAAYLKIRYGGMTYAEGSELLASLEKREHPPQRILELKLAYAKSADRAAMLAEIQPQPNIGSVVPLLGESAWVALLNEDGGEWLLDELARWQAVPMRFHEVEAFNRRLPLAFLDLDDDAKGRLGRRAERKGLWTLALGFYATKLDLEDFVSLLDRVPLEQKGSTLTAAEQRERLVRFALATAQRQPGFEIAKQPAEVQALDARSGSRKYTQPIFSLIRQFPSANLLMSMLNYVGDERVGTIVAVGLLHQIEAQQLDPANDPDAVFSAMIHGLDYVIGRKSRESALAEFGVSGMQGETAGEYADRAVARFALALFLRKNLKELPSRPSTLTKLFPWDQWAKVAEALRLGQAIQEQDQLVAADLLLAADRPSDALALWKDSKNIKIGRLRAHTLLHALDRRCNDLLRHPAPLSETLYRFDAR